MSKVTLDPITAINSSSLIKVNSNFQKIADELENTFSRDGTAPNTIETDIDANSHRIINLPEPVDNSEPLRKGDVPTFNLTDPQNNQVIVYYDNELVNHTLPKGDQGDQGPPGAKGDKGDEGERGADGFLGYYSSKGAVEGTIPSGEFLQTSGYSTPGDGGGALYKRVDTEPSHTGKIQAADNSWWELTHQVVTLEMFGGKADWNGSTGTDNHQPFLDARDYLGSISSIDDNSGGIIQLGLGRYYCSDRVAFNKRIEVRGMNAGGMGTTRNSEVVFAADTEGFVIIQSGGGTRLANIQISSLGGTDRTKCGVRMRGRGFLQEVNIRDFPGNGIDILATQGSSDPDMNGNANYWRIYGGRIQGCQHGINVDGADTNGGACFATECNANRGFGFKDSSFLGCDWYAMGTDGNGTLGGCYYNDGSGNKRYYAVTDDLEDLQTTTPGTNENVWRYQEDGGASGRHRLWESDNETEWVRGGAGALIDDNSRSILWGGYVGEPNQFPLVVNDRNITIGGYRGAGVIGTGAKLLTKTWYSLDEVNAINLAATNNQAGTTEVLRLYNSGSKTSNRGVQASLYAGQKADGVTQRLAGAIRAYCQGSGLEGTVLGVRVLEANNEESGVDAQLWNGNSKSTRAGVDNEWSFGTSAFRWLKGWFMNISLFPGSSVTPETNGEVTFELTSDTSLTVKVKGSDGVVRSSVLTLAE